jgi:RNA polymerase sigma-70 factor (TIGR02960 family)
MGMIDTAVPSQALDFDLLTDRHRRELQIHCYRMTGSMDEADDLVQETFERAWRRRETAAGPATARAWLYRIATNVCLDALARRKRTPRGGEVTWLQPCPDELLDEVTPHDLVADRETIELAFIVAVQHLPPRQRAVLLLRDVLAWPARDVAELLGVTRAAVDSALQRAHATMARHLPARRAEWPAGTDVDAARRALVARYVEASEAGDVEGLRALLAEDVRFTMPPSEGTWTGRDEVVGSWVEGGFGRPGWGALRCRATTLNRAPAVVAYARRAGDEAFRLLAVDVLRVSGGAVADITTFHGRALERLGLPEVLED